MHFYDLNINEVLYQVGHATDQKRHLVLIVAFRYLKCAGHRLRMTI